MLASRTQAVQLREWATGELESYDEPGWVPEYRESPRPIVYDVASPFAAARTRLPNTQELRKRSGSINERVPLNQLIDQLDMVAQADGRAVELSVFAHGPLKWRGSQLPAGGPLGATQHRRWLRGLSSTGPPQLPRSARGPGKGQSPTIARSLSVNLCTHGECRLVA